VRSSYQGRSREDSGYLMTQSVYTILIDGKEAFTDLTEDQFCDKMMDLAQDFYESGVPHPDSISHKVHGKD